MYFFLYLYFPFQSFHPQIASRPLFLRIVTETGLSIKYLLCVGTQPPFSFSFFLPSKYMGSAKWNDWSGVHHRQDQNDERVVLFNRFYYEKIYQSDRCVPHGTNSMEQWEASKTRVVFEWKLKNNVFVFVNTTTPCAWLGFWCTRPSPPKQRCTI